MLFEIETYTQIFIQIPDLSNAIPRKSYGDNAVK